MTARKPPRYSVEMGQFVHRNWEHNERARWAALAAERGVTCEALVEWYCFQVAWELDEDAPSLQ
jgi:hypothetical protein